MTEWINRNRALGLLIYRMRPGTTITHMGDGRWKCRMLNRASVRPSGHLPGVLEFVPGVQLDFEQPPRATALEALNALGDGETDDGHPVERQDADLWIRAGGLLADLPAGWSFACLLSGNYRCGNMPIDGGPMPKPMISETGADAMSTLNLALGRAPA
jgi:hypothetical protein